MTQATSTLTRTASQMSKEQMKPEVIISHSMKLDEAARGYEIFDSKRMPQGSAYSL